MSTRNSFDYASRQVGFGPSADINTNLHDSLLRRAMMTQEVNTYQPIGSSKTPSKGFARILRGLFTSLLLS
jgi:hypothetical protein